MKVALVLGKGLRAQRPCAQRPGGIGRLPHEDRLAPEPRRRRARGAAKPENLRARACPRVRCSALLGVLMFRNTFAHSTLTVHPIRRTSPCRTACPLYPSPRLGSMNSRLPIAPMLLRQHEDQLRAAVRLPCALGERRAHNRSATRGVALWWGSTSEAGRRPSARRAWFQWPRRSAPILRRAGSDGPCRGRQGDLPARRTTGGRAILGDVDAARGHLTAPTLGTKPAPSNQAAIAPSEAAPGRIAST